MVIEWVITGRLRLSLFQVMKLVAYCAVGSACVAPMWRLWRLGAVEGGTVQGLVVVALFEAIVVPLAWAGLSLFLVRRGAWRDGLVFTLLLWPVTLALAFAGWTLFAYTIPAYRNLYGTDSAAVAVHVVTIVALTISAVFLSRRLWNGYRSIRRPREAT